MEIADKVLGILGVLIVIVGLCLAIVLMISFIRGAIKKDYVFFKKVLKIFLYAVGAFGLVMVGYALLALGSEQKRTAIPPELSAKYFSYAQRAYTDETLQQYCKPSLDAVNPETRIFAEASLADSQARFEERKMLLAKHPEEIKLLLKDINDPFSLGDILFTIGLRYGQDNDLATAATYWECAAQKWFDTKSMVKLAALYTQKEGSNLGTDYNKGYFWILNAIYLDNLRNRRDSVAANGLGLMDTLQNDPRMVTVHHLEREKVEVDAVDFINLLYPGRLTVDNIQAHYRMLLQDK